MGTTRVTVALTNPQLARMTYALADGGLHPYDVGLVRIEVPGSITAGRGARSPAPPRGPERRVRRRLGVLPNRPS